MPYSSPPVARCAGIRKSAVQIIRGCPLAILLFTWLTAVRYAVILDKKTLSYLFASAAHPLIFVLTRAWGYDFTFEYLEVSQWLEKHSMTSCGTLM